MVIFNLGVATLNQGYHPSEAFPSKINNCSPPPLLVDYRVIFWPKQPCAHFIVAARRKTDSYEVVKTNGGRERFRKVGLRLCLRGVMTANPFLQQNET